MRIIAVANQKGGCGKTTTSINLAASMAFLGKRVLLIDLDPQGHASLGLGVKSEELEKSLYDVLDDTNGHDVTLDDVLVKVSRNLDLVPSQIVLSGIEQKLSGVQEREVRLAHKIKALQKNYHFIVIDCPPSVGLLTFNALCAASEVLIPVEPSFFSLHGLNKLMETVQFLRDSLSCSLRVHAVVTNFDGRASFAQEILHEVRSFFGEQTLHTIVRRNIRLQEAACAGKPITEFDRHANGFKDYLELATELIERGAAVQETVLEPVSDAQAVDQLIREVNAASTQVEVGTLVEEKTGTQVGLATCVAGQTVHFAFAASPEQSVQLAGSFNNWTPEAMNWSGERRVWEKSMNLTPGRWAYKFIVDGQWVTDPSHERTEQNEYGGVNSVVEVG